MTRFVVVLTLALLAYNGAVSFLPAYPVLYVPLNVTAAVLVLFAGRRAGLTFGEVGLRRSTVGRGVAWGAAFAGVVVLGIAVAAAVPGLRFMLDDARVAGIGIGLLAYRTLLRIPFGTVLLEELAFRGVLFAAWTRVHGVVRAAVGGADRCGGGRGGVHGGGGCALLLAAGAVPEPRCSTCRPRRDQLIGDGRCLRRPMSRRRRGCAAAASLRRRAI
jgi:hypothetical protein